MFKGLNINSGLPLIFKGKTVLYTDSIRSQHRTTKTNKERDCTCPPVFNSGIRFTSVSLLFSGPLPSGKESPVIATYLIQDWMKPRANLHVEGKTTVPLFAGSGRHVVCPAGSHFTERAVHIAKRFM